METKTELYPGHLVLTRSAIAALLDTMDKYNDPVVILDFSLYRHTGLNSLRGVDPQVKFYDSKSQQFHTYEV